MKAVTHTTRYKYILLLTNVLIVHVNLLSDKTNINNEIQKTLSPSNIRQASRKPASYRRHTNINLNDFNPQVNCNFKTPICVMTRYRNQRILKITLKWIRIRKITCEIFVKLPDDDPN
jgi:hypothetical protein